MTTHISVASGDIPDVTRCRSQRGPQISGTKVLQNLKLVVLHKLLQKPQISEVLQNFELVALKHCKTSNWLYYRLQNLKSN